MNKKFLLIGLISASLLNPIQSKAISLIAAGTSIGLNLASLLCYYKAFNSKEDKAFWGGAGLTLNFLAAHITNDSKGVTPLMLLAPQIALVNTNSKIIYNTAEFALYCGGAAYLTRKTLEIIED